MSTLNRNPLKLARRLAVLAVLGGMLLMRPTLSANLTVTTTNDTVDGTTTSIAALISHPGPDGKISLREAILAANNTAGQDTITLPSGTIQMSGGVYSVTEAVIISGNGSGSITIDAQGNSRIFSAGNVNLTLSGMTLSGGKDSSGTAGATISQGSGNLVANDVIITMSESSNQAGGALANGGGSVSWTGGAFTNNKSSGAGGAIVMTAGSLAISGTTFSGNSSRNAGGGAISFTGTTLSLSDATFSTNSSSAAGGAVLATVSGSATVSTSSFTSNTASNSTGGGLQAAGAGTWTFTDSELDSNVSGNGGGGVYVATTANVSFTRVTFVNNTSTNGSGGGLSVAHGGSNTTTATNVTLYSNKAPSNGGGGAVVSAGTLSLVNVTVASNTANNNAGGLVRSGGTLSVKNTLIAANTGGSGNCSGTITSLGNNLDSANTCALAGTGDHVNATAGVGTFANNGGLTRTLAITASSVAVNNGTATGAPTTDQRGYARSGTTDIGAYEFGGSAGFSLVVTSTADTSGTTCGATCTLRQAITVANASGVAGNTITFNIAGCTSGICTISPSSSLPTLTAPVSIDATTQPGWSSTPVVELSGSGANYGLRLNGVSGVAIKGLAIYGFRIDGINLQSVSSSSITSNYLGLRYDGSTQSGNGGAGISLTDATNNTIGGASASTRNVIAANGGDGIALSGSSTGNVISGNYIGVDASGATAAGNGRYGVNVSAATASGNTIGGSVAGAGNVVSGNSNAGIYIASNNNAIAGNLVGLNAAGTAALGNTNDGIQLDGVSGNTIGGTTAAERNVISGQSVSSVFDGIYIFNGSSANTIRGNYIGTDVTGAVALGNGNAGVNVAGGTNNVIGGSAAGQGNRIAYNGIGVVIDGSVGTASGNQIRGNVITANTGDGIELNYTLPTNDGAKSGNTRGNLYMDHPVFTAAAYSGTTLTLTGYVGSAAGQTTFANSTIDIFVSDLASTKGQGKTYLGSFTTGTTGTFTGATLTVPGGTFTAESYITATATDPSGNTSTFSANVLVDQGNAISGTVFEDVNYGGGLGRTRSAAVAAGGQPRAGARVELATVSGSTATFTAVTTTDAQGTYLFKGLATGTYMVRVVSGSVTSSRSGATAALMPVLTFRRHASAGTVTDVTNEVGGPAPNSTSYANTPANVGDAVPSSLATGAAEGVSTVAKANGTSYGGIDFGYNFSTVTNTNDTGQGSLRQAITNADTLGDDASLAQGLLTAGIDNVVFMISNGTSASGLRSSINYFSGGIATITPASALPALSTAMVLSAQTQPGWSANPIIELNGASAGASVDGLQLTGGGSTVAGFIINRYKRHGLYINSTGNTVLGCWIGTNSAGTAASANTLDGIYAAGSGNTIGGTGNTQGNVLSGNGRYGVVLAADAGTAGSSTVLGNNIGTNAAGTAAVANGSVGVYALTTGNTVGGSSTSGAGNLIAGNASHGVQLDAASNTVRGNLIGTTAAGTAALANGGSGVYVNGGSSQVIGGTSTSSRNTISGNAGAGIFLNAGGSHTVQGNYIGVTSAGTAALGNTGLYGLEVHGTGSNQIGSTSANGGNVISGQTGAGKGGVLLASGSNVLQGNKIGTNAAASAGLPNAGPGVFVNASVTANSIGGSSNGAGNTIAFNGTQGVAVTAASATGNKISRNAIYSNTGIGIDIAAAGRTANDGATNSTLGNSGMDTPVLGSAVVGGSSLTVSGYVGSASGQTAFGSATVELFKVSSDGTGYGQAAAYVGTLTANSSGVFSGTVTTAVTVLPFDQITATATDASGNTSEFAANFTVRGLTASGTVFEDVNYGGGSGRSLAASSGKPVAGATVELYSSNGLYISSTLSASDGTYSHVDLASGSYYVRVVSNTVKSTRAGSTTALLGVLTYRTTASGGSAVAVTNYVGGTDPTVADAGPGSAGADFSTTTFVYTAGITGTAQAVAPLTLSSASVTGLDFGFNFSTVVNTNDTGQGSLRQWLTNAAAFTDQATLVQSGLRMNSGSTQALPAAVETSIFMIASGNAVNGIRSTVANQLTNGVAVLNVASLLPGLSRTATSLDGSTQTANVGNTNGIVLGAGGTVGTQALALSQLRGPEVQLVGASGYNGITLSASNTQVRGLAAYGFAQTIQINGASTVVIEQNVLGTPARSFSDPGASARTPGHHIFFSAAASGVTISKNLIAYAGRSGITNVGSSGAAVTGVTITGNELRGNSAANTQFEGISPSTGAAGWTISGNLIAANAGLGIDAGTAPGDGHLIENNTLSGNGTAGVELVGVFVAGNSQTVRYNIITGHPGSGITVANSANVRITQNAIYANNTAAVAGRVAGISLSNDRLGSTVTANDGVKTAGRPNQAMDFPVITALALSGSNLTLTGYVGLSPGTSAFASSTLEFFVSNSSSSGYGEGQTYIGTLTASASGTFTGTLALPTGVTLTPGTTRITGTATDGSNNTSEFGPNYLLGLNFAGTVFEDINYGGGSGRSLATSGGTGVGAAVVELYDGNGGYLASTATATDGSYSFVNYPSGNYYIRVVGSSVRSSRSGSTASLLGVMTYRTTAASGIVVAATTFVGGTNPALTDPAAASSGAAFSTSTLVYSAGLSGTAQNVAPLTAGTSNLSGLDFGFNFDTVTNTNDSGPGSLRQAITNANTLGGDASLAQSGRTAGIENLVFMISNGTGGAGLRSSLNYFSGGVATIAPASALPEATAMVIDAQTQPGWTAVPIVELNGTNAGTGVSGLTARGGSTLRGLVINRYPGNGVQFLDAGGNTLAGCYIGTNAAGSAASANGGVGVNIFNSPNNTIGGTAASAGNVISGNAGIGVNLVGAGAGMVVQGNTIGLNAAGTARVANGSIGLYVASGAATIGGTSTAARNVIAGNTFENVQIGSAASSSTFQGNYVGTNASGAATITNGSDGLWVNGASSVQVGGTAAGAGNVFAGNAGRGVNISGSGSGNSVLGNSIFGNGNIGIDLGSDGATANDGAKNAGAANLLMDTPVIGVAVISGSTLTLSGYVGSAAGQATFASARVEVFVSDGSNANGQGKTYLGFLTTDASGTFSGSITGVSGINNGSTQITATATDGSNNTSEFGPNVVVGLTISGTVFEDLNYGGGSGRSLAGSSGGGVSGARVELYSASGTYVTATTTSASGAYTFNGLASATTYFVRVVNSTVLSTRSGSTAGLLPVMTYRTETSAGTPAAVTTEVGGTKPAAADAAAGANGTSLWTSCATENATCSFNGTRTVRYGGDGGGSSGWVTLVLTGGTSCSNGVFGDPLSGYVKACYLLNADYQSVATVRLVSASVSGADFGFNFDTVVNTNDSGQGSLRQAITNANALGGDGSLAQSGRTAGIENLVFMISNGTAASGLRSRLNYFSAGVATIAPASALPSVSAALVLDGQTQPGWTANPVIELNGAGAGASTNGLTINGAGTTVRGLVINRFGQNGIITATGTGLIIEGNTIGLNSAGTAASANALNGILIAGGSATIGGLTTSTRNVISGNTQNGVSITGGTVTVLGNYIGSNAANSGAVANGASGVLIASSNATVGGTAAGAGNVIRGNGAKGVAVANGAYTGNAVLGNSIYGNTSLGIDLKADGLTAANDGAKTAGSANLAMDSPVLSSASISGTTLTLSGYVGSAASQATFAAVRVEVFVSDASSAAGQGQTYLGTLTTDASGNFSGALTGVTGVSNGSTKLTATATDSSNNTSEFGVNVIVGLTVAGTVFEDANYGGGAGRSLSASGGSGVSGATLELYDNSGVFVTSTSSGSGGAYSFIGLAPGTYHVRVVSSSVLSQRSGAIAGLLPVMTFRTTATTGTAVAVTDAVGGTNPAFTDPGAASAGATFSTTTYAYSSGLSGTAHAVAPVTVGGASIGAVDFGFNFDTVSNTNASGPGSLAQVLTNANTLGGDASLAQSGRTAAIENVVFMIPNGTAGSGLRSTFNHFTGGVATISPSTGLPSISSALVIDAQTQPGWTANPVVELNGASAGNTNGLNVAAAGSTVRGLVINRYTYSGIALTASATVQGNWVGVSSSGSTASANGSHGINVTGGTATIGGTASNQGNVFSGNGGAGIWLAGGTAHVLQGNKVGVGADGNTRVGNTGFYGIEVGNGINGTTIGGTATGAGNVISGQTGASKGGLWLCSSSNTVQGNFIGTNAAGTVAVPNVANGILVCSGTTGNVIGGTTVAARNLISGNGGHGIAATGPASILGNSIGTNAAGSAALANTGNGIDISVAAASGSVLVGGTAAGAGNLISGNSGRGVAVQSGAAGNAIQGNRIHGNGSIAIDLNVNGVTANDGAKTAGAGNLLMDSPVFTSARATGSQLVVAGYVGSAASQSAFASSRVEIYASDNDGTGYGGGKTYLGALTADGSGNFSGTLTLPFTALAIGTKLTATATDTASNTSEFGANFSGLIVDLVVNDNGDAADAVVGDGLCATAGGVCTLRAAIAELNAWVALATPPSIVFALPGCSTVGAAACTITPASALPSVMRTVLIDGTSQTGFSTVSYSPIVEISGASAPGGTTGLVVSANNSTVRGLAINHFSGIGITLSGTGNTLVGLRIGLAPSTASAAANGGAGAYISGTGSVIGGSTTADRNVIAGNTGAGITVGASNTTITGNLIGTDASATAGLGNGGSAIAVLSASLTGVSISGNTLANNGGSGVGVAPGGAAQVQILANAMSGNGGLGIDLGNDGVTANTGVSNASLPNKGINYPVITGAGAGSNAVTVYGYIGTGTGQAAFAGARVEFFKAAADSSGYGEGQVYLGFLTADSAGHFSGTVAYTAGALNVGDAITATATDAAGNTSEFGPNWTTTSVAALTPGNFNAFDASTAAGALTGPITSKVAGTAASFAVIALDNSGTALHPGFTGTVSLTWVDARDDSGALSGSCRASWVDKGSAGSATFSNNSRITVALTPPASGTRSMRLKMTYTGGGSPVTACSNDAFADLPASYSWTGASDADSSTAGTARALDNTGASGGVVHRAGRPFTVRARALDATGALMTGYDGSPVLAAAGCLLPSGCTAATLTAPSTASSAGTYTNNLVSYAEVGALQVQLTDTSYADVDAGDTSIGVRTLTSALLAVGRFIPDSLSVTVSTNGQLGTANATCLASGAGATFIGQGFGWATAPQVTVTALNAAGATTTRWTGSLMKLAAGSGLAEVLTASNAGGATFSASYGTVTVTDLGAGQARVTASTTDRFLLDLPSGSVQDSTTPTFAWTLGVTDASEAAVAGNPTLSATANQGSVAFNSGGVFYSGRLSLSPGYGDVRSGLHLLAQLQRYTAAGWVTLTEDQGCVTIQNQNVAVETPTGVFATLGSCVAPMSGSVTTRGGRAWLAFPGTPAGAPGRLILRLAGPAATGSSCTTAGASAALVPLSQSWLLGGASAVGPQALATWGKPQRDALLRRETW